MKARLACALLSTGLLALCTGCRGSTPGRSAPAREPAAATAAPQAAKTSAAEAPLEGFSPPDAQGWGEAAGLRYLELVRGGGTARQALPMVVMIHGLGDRPRADWFGELDVPLRIVLPQAPTPHLGGFAWFEFRVRDMDPEALARGIERAAARLADALGLLARGRPTLGRPIVAGFSQGGMLSYALALHHPEVVSEAVPVSGMLPRPLWPSTGPPGRAPPIVGLHGDADAVVPIAPARALVRHLENLGYPARLREFADVGHVIAPPMDAMLVELLTAAAERASSQP